MEAAESTDAAPFSSPVGAVAIYHNIMWPKYKGAIFSALDGIAAMAPPSISFVQIAETDGDRVALAPVDMAYHTYPHELLFAGRYDRVAPWKMMATLLLHVARNKADLIVLPGYHRPEYWVMLLVCMLMGKRRGVFCDSTMFDNAPTRLKALLKRLFFSRCQVFFGYGTRSAEYLVAHGAKPEAVHAGCQAAALALNFDADVAFRSRLQQRSGSAPAEFLYVGRLSSEKGIKTLLDALAAFRRHHGFGNLVIVGSGPQLSELQAHARQLAVLDHVEFAGAKGAAELSSYYAKALCLVLPSTSEPWGLVVNEALHHGCPVIVSEHCGCRPDLIVDGVTGYAFDAGEPAQLFQRMESVWTDLRDAAEVARHCQAKIGTYTPLRAARRIRDGCVWALQAGRTA